MFTPQRFIPLLVALSLVAPALAGAWSDDPGENDLICGEAGHQANSVAAADGAGGMIAAWSDPRSGGSLIYAQRLDADGVPQWAAGGIQVCLYESWQQSPRIVPDDAGGAIIVWQDSPDEVSERVLYAQRVSAFGSLLWASFGQSVCTVSGDKRDVDLASDESGGVFAIWTDRRSGDWELYAQHLYASGVRAWVAAGVPVYTGGQLEYEGRCVAGSIGDSYYAWLDSRGGGSEIHVQRLAPSGLPMWEVDGRPAYGFPCYSWNTRIISDGAGGIILAGRDSAGGLHVVRAQRMDGSGARLWGDYGREVHGAEAVNMDVRLAPDGGGGACVLWNDNDDGVMQLRAQRLNASGLLLWTPGGLRVCGSEAQPGDQPDGEIAADGMGGFTFAWADRRYGPQYYLRYCQRLGPGGERLWGEGGQLITTQWVYVLFASRVITPTPGALVAVWEDDRNGDNDVFAQYIHAGGFHGNPVPVMSAVEDFPEDQGGEVLASWAASPLDAFPGTTIERYSLWVREAGGGARETPETELARLARHLPLARERLELMGRDGWVFVLELPALMEPEYTAIAPTFGDSTEAGIPWVECRVIAHTEDPWRYLESLPLAGYSVDNLAPGAPRNLSGEETGGIIQLSWEPSGHHDEDLAFYRIYRGDAGGFPLDPAHRIGTSTDESYADEPGGGTWFYRCTGVDVHGNEGEGSNEAMVESGSSAVNDPPAASMPHVDGPNPFEASTTLCFSLPRETRATLSILDASGRQVSLLVEGRLRAGTHAWTWDGKDRAGRPLPSGLYFGRLRADDVEHTWRLVLLRRSTLVGP